MKTIARTSFMAVLFVCILAGQGFTQSHRERFQFKFSGGYSRTGLGDLNLLYADENEKFEELARLVGETMTNKLELDHWGLDGEAEFLVRLNRSFSLGLGAGFLTRGTISSVAREGVIFTYSRTFDLNLQAPVVFLNGYWTLPLSSRLNAFVRAGVGYYPVDLKLAIREEQGAWWQTERIKIKDASIGYQGGIGIEFTVTGLIGLFIEGSARVINLNRWHGSLEYMNQDSDEIQYQGAVWTVEEYDRITRRYYTEGRFQDEDPSETEFDIQNARKSKINLSGFGLKAGIIIKFGKQ